MFNFLALFFGTASNFWIWEILSENLISFLLILTASAALFLVTIHKNRLVVAIAIFSLLLLIINDISNSKTNIFNKLSDIEKLRVTENLASYMPKGLLKFGNSLYFPTFWTENKTVRIVWQRFEKNLFDNLDINRYFFAGHPRERDGVNKTERFPYILLPLWVVGIITLSKKNYRKVLIIFLITLGLLSMFGGFNDYYPVSLFPFFIITITHGIIQTGNKISGGLRGKVIFSILAMMYLGIFIQTAIYAK